MSASLSAMRGGQPSTTQPIAGPWLSPKVVTRKECPNVLNDMAERLGRTAWREATKLKAPNGLRQGALRLGSPWGPAGQMGHARVLPAVTRAESTPKATSFFRAGEIPPVHRAAPQPAF